MFARLAGLCRHRNINAKAALAGGRSLAVRGMLVAVVLAGSATAFAAELPGATQTAALQQRLRAALAAKGPDYRPRTEHLNPDGSPFYTNRLILEDSPYLLQHAHNPVNWYAWGEEAFAKSRNENKPVFLSIGYSTCHWCHVMERESFEDPQIAQFLNEHFVAIKVDRERRPDIDTIYMTAVQLMNGRGGWPLSSFLTPAGETFYGGTYFTRAQFLDLLQQIEKAWRENRPAVEKQANQLAAAVTAATRGADVAGNVNDDTIGKAINSLQKIHDPLSGGFGPAPKFPNEPYYLFLLDHALRNDDDDIVNLIQFDLHAMARGGIHDQVGGGFHRYATDAEWQVPHFEKMLYNQAQLSRAYGQAWRLTGDDGLARIARQTADYVLRDMTSPDGGFYSATDADSAGSEGLFFIWTEQQIRAALTPADARLAIDLYGVTAHGNFEGANILHLPLPLADFAQRRGIDLPLLLARVDNIRAALYSARSRRVPPQRDEKIVTAWNGMMIAALAELAGILQEPRYRTAALRAAEFLWSKNYRSDGTLWRIHLDGRSSMPALQDDYAWLADGFIHLYDLTGDARWLERATLLAATMTRLFWDDKAGGYFMNTDSDGVAAMARPKDSIDGAVPSGNAVALQVLAKLAQRSGEEAERRTANRLLAAFADAINKTPIAYGYMLHGAQLLANGDAGPQQYAARGAAKVSAHMVKGTLMVDVAIRPGWHIQAHEPLQVELIATVLSLDPSAVAWLPGAASYPSPKLKTLDFQNERLALYEGQIRIAMKVQRATAAVASPLIPVVLRLQACNDNLCLPPERHVLQVPAPQ